MKKKLFYCETGMGCCLKAATDEDAAYKDALRSVGTSAGVDLVREATDKDIAWVSGMGGRVPEIKT